MITDQLMELGLLGSLGQRAVSSVAKKGSEQERGTAPTLFLSLGVKSVLGEMLKVVHVKTSSHVLYIANGHCGESGRPVQ